MGDIIATNQYIIFLGFGELLVVQIENLLE